MPTRWSKAISRELELLDDEIRARTRSRDSDLDSVVDYILSPGGKRIRPAVVILSFLASDGDDIAKVLPLAAAIELIHSGTLVHDDINDSGSMRRGKRATHLQYGQAKAIIAGDYLFVKAFEISTEYPPIIMKLTAEICSQLAEGEFIQNRHLRNFRTSESEYLEIVEKKTALPLSLAARVGALMADGQEEEGIAKYGYNIGIAFQIADDVLDIAGDPRLSKKTTALDIRLGSPNMLIIRALNSSPDRKRILSLLSEPDPDMKMIIDLILKTDAIEYSRKKAALYAERAKKAIVKLKGSRYSHAMEDLADFIAERDS